MESPFLLEEGIVKSLVVGGLMVTLGAAKVWSFWHGLLIGGTLVFSVALLLLWVELFCPAARAGGAI